MISFAACWQFRLSFDFLALFRASFDRAFRSLARSGLRGSGAGWGALGALGGLLGHS